MKYTNQQVRRQNRIMEEDAAIQLLKNGEYGILSMQAEEGGGYGIPLNFAWNEEGSIYLHCATEGRKLRCLELCNRISFCVVGNTMPIPDQFSTEYESIVLMGTAHTGLNPEERMKALEWILDKYSPDYKETGMKYAASSFARTEIIRLDIEEWSGKCRYMHRPAPDREKI